jgi:hypothetical protein
MTATLPSLPLIPAASPGDGNECTIIVFIYRVIHLNPCSQNLPKAYIDVPNTCMDPLHRVSKGKYTSFRRKVNRDSNESPCSSVLSVFILERELSRNVRSISYENSSVTFSDD